SCRPPSYDCCRNNCCTPSDVRLATLDVSSALNSSLWASIVSAIISPGVGSLLLLVIACDSDWIFSAPLLRFSNVDISARMPCDGSAGLATASVAPTLPLPPPRYASVNLPTSYILVCGCAAGAAAGLP